jgi:CheY-like chemotaxis protein
MRYITCSPQPYRITIHLTLQSQVRTRTVDHERIRQFSSRVPDSGFTVLTRCRRTYVQTVSTMTTEGGCTQKVRVLLAGVGARSAPMLNDYLRKRGCEIALASSCKEVQRMLRERHYDLVLSEFMLSNGTAYQLMACLRGTDATMFFSMWSNTAAGGSTPFLKDRITRTTQAYDRRSSESCWTKSCSTGFCGMPRNSGADRERIGATT